MRVSNIYFCYLVLLLEGGGIYHYKITPHQTRYQSCNQRLPEANLTCRVYYVRSLFPLCDTRGNGTEMLFRDSNDGIPQSKRKTEYTTTRSRNIQRQFTHFSAIVNYGLDWTVVGELVECTWASATGRLFRYCRHWLRMVKLFEGRSTSSVRARGYKTMLVTDG